MPGKTKPYTSHLLAPCMFVCVVQVWSLLYRLCVLYRFGVCVFYRFGVCCTGLCVCVCFGGFECMGGGVSTCIGFKFGFRRRVPNLEKMKTNI